MILKIIDFSGMPDMEVEVDPITVKFFGATENYPSDHNRSFNRLEFCLADPSQTEKLVDELKKVHSEPNLIQVFYPGAFYDDRRPQICIKTRSGKKQIHNPPKFYFKK